MKVFIYTRVGKQSTFMCSVRNYHKDQNIPDERIMHKHGFDVLKWFLTLRGPFPCFFHHLLQVNGRQSHSALDGQQTT